MILFEGGGKTHMSGIYDIEAVKAALKDTNAVPVAEPVASVLAATTQVLTTLPSSSMSGSSVWSESNHAIFAHNDGILRSVPTTS